MLGITTSELALFLRSSSTEPKGSRHAATKKKTRLASGLLLGRGGKAGIKLLMMTLIATSRKYVDSLTRIARKAARLKPMIIF